MSLVPPSTGVSGGGYREVSKAKALQLPADGYRHAAHGMVYARLPGKFLGKYDYHYAVMVCCTTTQSFCHYANQRTVLTSGSVAEASAIELQRKGIG